MTAIYRGTAYLTWYVERIRKAILDAIDRL